VIRALDEGAILIQLSQSENESAHQSFLEYLKTLGDRPWTISRIRKVLEEAPDAGTKSKVLRQLSLENLKDLDKKSRSQIKFKKSTKKSTNPWKAQITVQRGLRVG
jgi:hypothetical protein